MPKFRVSSILVFSVLLIIIAVGLLATSVYFLLDAKDKKKEPVAEIKKASAIQEADTAAIVSAAVTLDTSHLKPITSQDTIKKKLDEIYALKKEIPSVITNQTSDTTITNTREKIAELLKRIDDLKNRTTRVETENRFLKSMLEQLTDELKTKEQSIRRVNTDNRFTQVSNVTTESNRVSVGDVRLGILNEEGQETNRAEEGNKLTGSFNVRSNANTTASFYVVVTQPNGKVLQNSSWDGGIFETAEGRKLYTSKVLFYGTSESKRSFFTVTTDNLQKGTYTVQVYHNGSIVGRGSKTVL
jgi:hypothetical protein